jgi:hypothetical protein
MIVAVVFFLAVAGLLLAVTTASAATDSTASSEDYLGAQSANADDSGAMMPTQPTGLSSVDPNKVAALANAIAFAEWSYKGNPSTVKNNNPGNLTRDFGFSTVGVWNSAGVLIFDSFADGWSALLNLVGQILGGNSSYDLNWTWQQFAAHYTGNDSPTTWAAAAARSLGVTPDQTVSAWLNS